MRSDAVFLKQIAIRKMVVDLAIDEKIIEQVLIHAFNGAKKAFHSNNSIEISGFGKYIVSPRQVLNERQKITDKFAKWGKQLEDPNTDDMMRKNRILWTERAQEDLDLIKTLLHEN